MYENDWYAPHSDYCDGFIFGMVLNGTSWDALIIDGEEEGRFCPEYYGSKEQVIALELPVEGEAYIDEEDIEDYPYPQRPVDYNFKTWVQMYLPFTQDDDLEDLFSIPITVTKENGLFAFAIGFPYQDGGFPVIEIFYATYGDNTVKHFTWHIDDTPRYLFQDGSFIYAILKKLKTDRKLPDSIDPYCFFEDCAYVNKYKSNLDWICENN